MEKKKEIKKLFTDRGLASDDERFKHILLEAPSLLFLPASTIDLSQVKMLTVPSP